MSDIKSLPPGFSFKEVGEDLYEITVHPGTLLRVKGGCDIEVLDDSYTNIVGNGHTDIRGNGTINHYGDGSVTEKRKKAKAA